MSWRYGDPGGAAAIKGDKRLRTISNLCLCRNRCTEYAEEFLRELESNPKLPDLLDRLATLDGLITRADIEQALLELRKLDGTRDRFGRR